MKKQAVGYLCVCVCLPVRYNILKANKQLSVYVKFIDGGVDGIATRPVTMESVSISNNQEDSAANLEHLPVCGTKCLHEEAETKGSGEKS